MFSIRAIYSDGGEELLVAKVIRAEPCDAGKVLVLDEERELEIGRGDVVYVMNVDGHTVCRYRG